MTQRNGGTATWELTAPAGAVDPSPDVLHLLAHGDPLKSPEQVAASVLLGLWNAGWSWDQAVQVAGRCPGLRADVAKPSRGQGWLRRTAAWCERAATDAPNGDRAQAVRADLAVAVPRIQARQWPRCDSHRVGPTSLTAVTLGCVKLAANAGRTTGLHLSVRSVAEASGVSVGTAQAAMGRLRADLVLVRQDRATVRDGVARAATYSLHVDVNTVRDDRPDDDDRPGVPTAVTELLAHDCWRWGGLGGSAGQVWAVLDDRAPLTAEQVAQLRHRSVTWTRELLRRLARHGLAVRSGDTWTRCTVAEAPRRLDVAAGHVGTAGKGDQQRARHAAEREQHAEQRRLWLLSLSRARQAQGLAGVTCDPGTGLWVDLATGEVVQPPGVTELPPLEPAGLTLDELLQYQADQAADVAAQRDRDREVKADQRVRSDALAERLHGVLDEQADAGVVVAGWTVDGVPQPRPGDVDPLAVDYSRLHGRDVRVQLALVPGSLALLEQQAEQWRATFARVAAVGKPLQDLAAQWQVTADRVAQWAAAREGSDA